eukprot:gene26134-11854_t
MQIRLTSDANAVSEDHNMTAFGDSVLNNAAALRDVVRLHSMISYLVTKSITMAAPRTKRTKRYATRKTLALSSIPEDSVHLEAQTTTSAQQAMSSRDMMLVKCYGEDIASLKRNLVFLRKRQNVAIWLNKLFRGTLRGKVDKLEMSIVVKEGSIEHLQKLIKKTKLGAHASNLDSEGEATQDILQQHSVSCELKHVGEPQTLSPKTSGGGDSAGGSPRALAPIYPLAPQLARPPLASTSGGAASAGGSPPIAPQLARPPLAGTSVDPLGPERQYRRPRDASLGADATKSGGSDARGLGQGPEVGQNCRTSRYVGR